MINPRPTKVRLNALLLIAIAVAMLAPFYWMIATSMKTQAENMAWPLTFWPREWTLENYRRIFAHPEDTPVLLWFRNSVVAAGVYAVLSVALSLMAGFALARMRFAGRGLYLGLLLFALALPAIVLLIPSFLVVNGLGMTDTLWSIIIPGLCTPFGVLLVYQVLSKVPNDLEEAAVLDGATSLQVLWYLMIPSCKPVLITLLVLNFMGNWNDYFWPFINLFSPDTRTMPIGMATLQGRYELDYGSTMAGATLMALPSILIFICIQKYYIRSISLSGGMKE